MMKTKFILLTLGAFSLVGGLSACAEQTPAPVQLEFGRKYDKDLPLWDAEVSSRTYKVGNVKVLGYSDLGGLIEDRKASFVLLVADVTSDCTCFSSFKASIESYLQSSNAFFYAINPNEFDGAGKNTYGLNVTSTQGNESVAIFEDGALKYQRKRSGENDSWSNDPTAFASWMKARVKVSNMLYIDLLQLEQIVVDSTPFNGLDHFTLGFFRERCTDCRYLADSFLKSYNASEHAESYVIDCDVPGIHDPKDGSTTATDESKTQWAEFKIKYGLALSPETPFGFDSGYVPTFLYYSNGVVADAAVYDNDSLAPSETPDTYKIDGTYWDGSRQHEFFSSLKNNEVTNFLSANALQAISNSDVDTYSNNGGSIYLWKHEKAALYHDPLLKGFLDFYISK